MYQFDTYKQIILTFEWKNTIIFISVNAFEYIVCKTLAISYRSGCIWNLCNAIIISRYRRSYIVIGSDIPELSINATSCGVSNAVTQTFPISSQWTFLAESAVGRRSRLSIIFIVEPVNGPLLLEELMTECRENSTHVIIDHRLNRWEYRHGYWCRSPNTYISYRNR